MVRAIILAATIAALIVWYLDRPTPVKAIEVRYCPVTYWTWIEIEGRRVKLWHQMFGPCSDMDRFENA